MKIINDCECGRNWHSKDGQCGGVSWCDCFEKKGSLFAIGGVEYSAINSPSNEEIFNWIINHKEYIHF